MTWQLIAAAIAGAAISESGRRVYAEWDRWQTARTIRNGPGWTRLKLDTAADQAIRQAAADPGGRQPTPANVRHAADVLGLRITDGEAAAALEYRQSLDVVHPPWGHGQQ